MVSNKMVKINYCFYWLQESLFFLIIFAIEVKLYFAKGGTIKQLTDLLF